MQISDKLLSNLLSPLVLISAFLFLTLSPAHALIGTQYQMQLGNPSGATADTNNHDHFLIQRTIEAMDYNDNRGEPNWASWDLTASDSGTNSRISYITDTNLPSNFYRVKSSDYDLSGYDRGHLCPAADRDDTPADVDLAFLMSNILPQASANNSGVWLQFENYCRSLATNNYELLITCGGSGFGGARINTNGPVIIPDYVWKIVVVVPLGAGMATNRITETNRVIAIKVPNNDNVTNNWPTYVTSANEIQVDTGLTFFTGLPSDVAAALRTKVDGETNPPPMIFSFSPTNGTAGTGITINGTNFSSASSVAFNGASASFILNSSNQITATVPTNGSSGFVSVTTPSGTAISTNLFTVLSSGGGTIYSGLLAGWDVSTLPGGLNNYGPSPFAATSVATNLTVGGLTRGSGVRTNGTAGAAGWGGTGFTNATSLAAITSNQFVTFSVAANSGYSVSFTTISRFDYYRSPSAPTTGLLQYQIGSGAFTDITNISYPIISTGATNSPIALSGFAALQDIGANTNVTFRIVNYGGTSSAGTWYIYNTAGSSAPDFVVQGTVTQILTNTPAVAPILSSPTLTNGQFRFTLTGTTGSNYIVQVTTNLSSPNWIPLVTNAAPFTFIETNENYPYTFYRALLEP
jgi:DNA/RNA endonuclease G (NUC1)